MGVGRGVARKEEEQNALEGREGGLFWVLQGELEVLLSCSG